MPVLIVAVVFFAIFIVIGIMGTTAMIGEHKSRGVKLFSGHWSDLPKAAKPAAK